MVVNFWASWCLACRDEHPDLLGAWERYRERGVVLVGIDYEDSESAALAYAEEMGGDWPLVTDPGSRTAIEYGVFYPNGSGNAGPISIQYGMRGVPETYFIAPDGRLVRKWNTLTAADMDQFLAELQRASDSRPG